MHMQIDHSFVIVTLDILLTIPCSLYKTMYQYLLMTIYILYVFIIGHNLLGFTSSNSIPCAPKSWNDSSWFSVNCSINIFFAMWHFLYVGKICQCFWIYSWICFEVTSSASLKRPSHLFAIHWCCQRMISTLLLCCAFMLTYISNNHHPTLIHSSSHLPRASCYYALFWIFYWFWFVNFVNLILP